MYGWNQAPTKALYKHTIGSDDAPEHLFEIGEYAVEIPTIKVGKDEHGNDTYAEPPPVTYRSKHRHSSDPRATLPSMEVADGQIRIELTDLVGLVLSRLEPYELAQTLWQDEEVRREFMSCLITRYNSQGIGDKERRDFLGGVLEAVHDKALDRLASVMAKLEYEVTRQFHHYDEIRRINDVLRDRNITVIRTIWKDGEAAGTEEVFLQFDAHDHAVKLPDGSFARGEFEIAGKSWQDARDFWRNETLKQFPFPPAPAAETAADDQAVL